MEVREPSSKYLIEPAYKQTEAGTIPDQWELVTLGELLAFQNGVNADKAAYGHGVPFVNVLEVITRGTLSAAHIPGRVDLLAQVVAAFAVQAGDVLFNRTSETQEEVGLASIYEGSEVAVFGGFVIRGRPRGIRLLPRFASYALRARSVRVQIVARGQGAVRANIGQADLAKIQLALPPTAEQEAIAEALSDADALIESLEQLLAKKRQLKQGAMQELLTGKRRLPGFSGEWGIKRLDEVADILSGGTPSTTQPHLWDGEVPWCTPTDITALNGSKYLRQTARTITAQGLKQSSAELIPANSVVMTSRATIGECAINAVPVATNQGFKNFVPFPGSNGEFLYYLLQVKKQDFISLCGGSTFLEIGKTQLATFEVCLPNARAEQTAIAAILADMDAELTALEAKLTKARHIKLGMMQNLLTGRIRLV